jgi:hypothetical protein
VKQDTKLTKCWQGLSFMFESSFVIFKSIRYYISQQNCCFIDVSIQVVGFVMLNLELWYLTYICEAQFFCPKNLICICEKQQLFEDIHEVCNVASVQIRIGNKHVAKVHFCTFLNSFYDFYFKLCLKL